MAFNSTMDSTQTDCPRASAHARFLFQFHDGFNSNRRHVHLIRKLSFNSTMDPTQTLRHSYGHHRPDSLSIPRWIQLKPPCFIISHILISFQFHDGSNSNPIVNTRQIKAFPLYQSPKKTVNLQSCKNPGRFTDFDSLFRKDTLPSLLCQARRPLAHQ